jgi:hypothetical protein
MQFRSDGNQEYQVSAVGSVVNFSKAGRSRQQQKSERARRGLRDRQWPSAVKLIGY